jgi:hypothetical protein
MFLFYYFSYFLYLRFFLVKRHKTFLVLVFKSFFFGLVILLFWFWVLVKCKKWFIFCIWFWIFIYFILYWLYPPFYSVFPFFIWHPPLVSPFYSVIKDQFILICHPFAPATAPAAAHCSCFNSSSLVVARRLFVPAKCVRIKKLCKTHYKCYYTTMIYAPVFYTPHYLSSYPSKKNNYFLSTSHLVYPFQKSVVLCC